MNGGGFDDWWKTDVHPTTQSNPFGVSSTFGQSSTNVISSTFPLNPSPFGTTSNSSFFTPSSTGIGSTSSSHPQTHHPLNPSPIGTSSSCSVSSSPLIFGSKPAPGLAFGQTCSGLCNTQSAGVLQSNPPSLGQTNSAFGQKMDSYITGHRAGEAAIVYEHEADVEVLMPKLKHADYYTEPGIQELVAKERVEPGFCQHVKNFVVGRHGYGIIKFIGETDVRGLDLESIVQFNNREVFVYMDDSKKPPMGQGLNKPAEVTLLNIKCFEKKT
ncbi:Nuclear pore complex protein nup98a [Thalictrum thalictroides]|uniref:Nuclear pore complex protein nup98a n=1 Tax=Thalictrum thalictroides TaxID=46969 RepID=A0A7J6WGD9_THATH|nr:Nuclear pore complex protein nup98a [Thalictrum thalictroides]